MLPMRLFEKKEKIFDSFCMCLITVICIGIGVLTFYAVVADI